jgi:hypothetical protein
MSVSFLSPNRTVLSIADEALFIYSLSSRGVQLVESVPWDSPNFAQNVGNTIIRDCGKRPLVIVNDMVEQHYRKERVVRAGVSFLDRAGIVKRKLNVAFPNYPIRAAYPLKEKITKGENRLAADIFIFAASPDSNQFNKTMEAASASLASITTFCLLPIESSDLVRELSNKLAGKKRIRSKWAFFVGQHRNGGLRQIVTKDGELALTRMTPIIDNDDDPALWAQEVYQEFKATMSYLTRFGYQPEDGLDAIIIANQEGGAALESLIEEKCNFQALSASMAAKILGLHLGAQEDDRFADSLHAAWIGRKSKFILPMKATRIDAVSKPRQAAVLASVLLFGGACYLGYETFNSTQSLLILNDEVYTEQAKVKDLEVALDLEVKKKESLGFDITLVQSSIAVKRAMEKEDLNILRLFYGLGRALSPSMRVDAVRVNLLPAPVVDPSAAVDPNAKPPMHYVSSFQITYPSTYDVKLGNSEVTELSKRLQDFLPDHEVKIQKLLKDFEYNSNIEIGTGNSKAADSQQQDFIAEIEIKGPQND